MVQNNNHVSEENLTALSISKASGSPSVVQLLNLAADYTAASRNIQIV